MPRRLLALSLACVAAAVCPRHALAQPACIVHGLSVSALVRVTPAGAAAFDLQVTGVTARTTPGSRTIHVESPLVFDADVDPASIPVRIERHSWVEGNRLRISPWTPLEVVTVRGNSLWARPDLATVRVNECSGRFRSPEATLTRAVPFACSVLSIDPPPARYTRIVDGVPTMTPPSPWLLAEDDALTGNGLEAVSRFGKLALHSRAGGGPRPLELSTPRTTLFAVVSRRGAWVEIARLAMNDSAVRGWVRTSTLEVPGRFGWQVGGGGYYRPRPPGPPADSGLRTVRLRPHAPVYASPSAASPWAHVAGEELAVQVRTTRGAWVSIVRIGALNEPHSPDLQHAWITRDVLD